MAQIIRLVSHFKKIGVARLIENFIGRSWVYALGSGEQLFKRGPPRLTDVRLTQVDGGRTG